MNRLWGLTLLLLAGVALAQPSVSIGGRKTNDPGKWIQVQINDDGSIVTTEAFKDRDFKLLQASAISAVFQRVSAAQSGGTYVREDSSTAIDTRGLNYLGLMIFPTLLVGGSNVDTCTGGLYALGVRGHYAAVSDSQNTFTQVSRNAATNPINPDSLFSLADIAQRKFDKTAALADTSVLPGELALVLPNISRNPRGIFYVIDTRAGSPFRADFTSIYLRAIHTYKNVSGNAQQLETGSGSSPVAQRVKIRIDAYGAR